MAVHGVSATAKGKNSEPGDWTLKTNTGKPVLDEKNKPIAGLSFRSASDAARSHLTRTGEYVFPIRG